MVSVPKVLVKIPKVYCKMVIESFEVAAAPPNESKKNTFGGFGGNVPMYHDM